MVSFTESGRKKLLQMTENMRLCSIIGFDAEEKHGIIKMVAEIFAETRRELFVSPFDCEPELLLLPELNAAVIASDNSIMAQSPMNRTYCIGDAMSSVPVGKAKVIDYITEQSRRYKRRYFSCLRGAGRVLREYSRKVGDTVDAAKVTELAEELLRGLDRSRGRGRTVYRGLTAVTCSGYSVTAIPDGARVTVLADEYAAASSRLIRRMAEIANDLGHDAVLSRAFDALCAPLHLYIPDVRLLFLSKTPFTEKVPPECGVTSLDGCYYNGAVPLCEHELLIVSEQVRKFLDEAAVCARLTADIKAHGRHLAMPYISKKKAAVIASDIVADILNQ